MDLPASELLAAAAWPAATGLTSDAIAADFERAYHLVTEIRTLRAKQNVKPKQRIALHATTAVSELVAAADGLVETLAGIEAVTGDDDVPPVNSPLAFEGSQVFLSGLTDEVDLGAEQARLEEVVAQKTKQIGGFKGKLSNDGYVNGAPPHLVQETRDLLAAAVADLCLLYTSPSPRDLSTSRMPSSA